MAFDKNTKGQKGLTRLQKNDFRLFSEDEILNYNMSPAWKDIVLYVSRKNSFGTMPTMSDIKVNNDLSDPRKALKALEENFMLFDVTVPELINFYEIEPVSRKDCLPNNLSWLWPYMKKMSTKTNGKSWNDRKQNPRRPNYPIYFVANVKDSQGVPCYAPLGLHVKNK
jgi:hypothetical protein